MASTLTKTGIRFDEVRVYRVVVDGSTDQMWASVGYVIETAEGETIHRDFSAEMTGAARTRILNMLSDLTTQIKTSEDIT